MTKIMNEKDVKLTPSEYVTIMKRDIIPYFWKKSNDKKLLVIHQILYQGIAVLLEDVVNKVVES